MSEQEVSDPVVEDVVKEEISPEAELTTPPPDSQEVADEIVDLSEDRKTIPKDRFDQVWARSKKAEARLEQLQADLQREREERIRLEERSKVKEEQATQKEMTWAELETGIAEGKWSRDQAQEYKDKMTEQRLERKFREKQAQESTVSNVLGEINQYKQLIPDITVPYSESRMKVEKAYAHLVRNGAPQNYATELAATMSVFGDIDTVKARKTVKQTITSKEPLMETHTPSRNVQKPTKSFEDGLPEHKRDFYKKLMKHGAIKTWKDAEEIEKRRGK